MNRATLRARLSGPQSQSGSIPESSPVAALCLYWIFSVIIALAPPMDVAYSFFVELYSYTILVWLSFFLTIGLLWQQWKPGSTWVKERNFKPWGGPLMAIIYLIINLFLIIAPFIPPDKTSEQKIASTMRQAEGYPLKKTTIPWYVSPTVGVSIFVAGAIYWIMFRFFWPKISRRELQVKRIPVLLDGIQVKEFVECKWVRTRLHHYNFDYRAIANRVYA
jgi:hypothetical protein